MAIEKHLVAELLGIVLVLASTATQMFYVEPSQREIAWRMNAFAQQQNAQVLARTVLDSRIATLKALNAPGADITAAEAERASTIAKFQTADANISDYVIAKQPIEDMLQMVVLVLFATGTLLAGYGRLVELLGSSRRP